MQIRWTLSFFLTVIAYWSATAQTFRLFLADLENTTESVLLIDSTAGIVAGPVFDPRLPILYYSKGKEIIAFNIESGERNLVFKSDGPVHALRITPDGKTLTFLAHLPGNELKRFALNGGAPAPLAIRNPVENYIWIDDNNLLVIEPGKPNTLQLITLRPFRQMTVAKHVGVTLTKVPAMTSFAFVHKLSVDSWSIKTIGTDGSISILAETPPESDVFAITSTGTPVAFYESQLHRYNKHTNDWTPIPTRIQGIITELQPSSGEAKLAFWAKTNQ